MSECGDPDHTFYPQRRVCYADMEAAAARRRYDELHKDAPFHDGTFSSWAAETSLEHAYHYLDGVTFFVADEDLDPAATWLMDPEDMPPDPDDPDQGGGETPETGSED